MYFLTDGLQSFYRLLLFGSKLGFGQILSLYGAIWWCSCIRL